MPKNETIQTMAREVFDARDGIRVGDYVRLLDGRLVRVCNAYKYLEHRVQTIGPYAGSYYMDEGGLASYSGGLDPGMAGDTLVLTDEVMDGEFWHFDMGWPRAHAGVNYKLPCRVYKEVNLES